MREKQRKKHNCWARKKHFLELLFGQLGSSERLDTQGGALREASITAGLSNYSTAHKIMQRYLR